MSSVKDIFSKLASREPPSASNPSSSVPSGVEAPVKPPMSADPPRFLIIGAGSRGRNYAEAIDKASCGVVSAVAEPLGFKREILGRLHIWGKRNSTTTTTTSSFSGEGKTGNEKEEGKPEPAEGESFSDWREFLEYETDRRRRAAAGEPNVPDGVDGVFVCVLDEMHRDVVVGLAPLGLHVMCEKPLACTLDDCIAMYKALRPSQADRVFSVGHVLRYSPHNMMLRKLLVEDRVIGDLTSVVHTEPVGWWHFTHSYVRGNWRRHDKTGPSLLTKSCHDIDLLLWLLCSPEKAGQGEPHLPATVSSTGGVHTFKKSRKPRAAGSATNCMKCPLGDQGCKYSAKNIYLGSRLKGLGSGNTDWPVRIVVHDIEDLPSKADQEATLTRALEEDYDAGSTPEDDVASRNWFGRCVFESDNDVCDDQFVTITFPETPAYSSSSNSSTTTPLKPAKRATFHMVSHTTKICERYSHFYGDLGEVYADSRRIVVDDFATGQTRTFHPRIEDTGHGGGDIGLARQFVSAVDRVKSGGWAADRAQAEFIGCTLEEVVRSHALVFAAEEARQADKVLNWQEFWDREVASKLDG